MREFTRLSTLTEGSLALALAPALTPMGLVNNPHFFAGFASHPQILARGLLVLADITSTRYFKYTPVAQRDPVLSAQGDRLRAECFSACNGVYARLDLLQAGFDGKIGFGTTNVDIGSELRAALVNITQQDKMRITIGDDGLDLNRLHITDNGLAKLDKTVRERVVQMPESWVRALGNACEIHHDMQAVFTLSGVKAQAFIASLPPATGKNQCGWITPTSTGTKFMQGACSCAAYVSGLHRLSALKRLMTAIKSITFYMPKNAQAGAFMLVAEMPGAYITISLTAEAWHGYSGEGALLSSLAQQEVLEDAEDVHSVLKFDSAINEAKLAQNWSMNKSRVDGALALLAVSGKLGYDAKENAYFHRELPDNPNRAMKDNPRLVAARKLKDKVQNAGENVWAVPSNDVNYRVTYSTAQGAQLAKCTCTWYLNHQNMRGPCKHILAVQLKEDYK